MAVVKPESFQQVLIFFPIVLVWFPVSALNLKYIRQRYRDVVVERTFFQTLARYLLLALLFYAPWAYGSTRPTLVNILDDGLLLCFGLHLSSLVLEGRFPRYPLIPTVCLALLVLQGLWMCFNARSYLDDDFWEFVPLIQPFPHLPGTWDKAASLFTLKTLCAMTAAFLVACDLMANEIWKLRLWRTMGIAGCSIIVYGLIQKGLGPDSIISMYQDPYILPTFFGPYRYHANAGAYLNLVWPVLLSLFIHSWRKGYAYVERAIWSCALVMGLAACFVNTSKAAAAITVLMMFAAVLSFASFFRNNLIRSRYAARILTAAFILGFVAILIYGGITNQLQGRWDKMFNPNNSSDTEGRLLVYGACIRMIPEAGWLGFGPGTFSRVFPFHTLYLGDQIKGFWVYAHEDYLQTVVEYGYLGSLFWSVLLFGSIIMAILRGLRSSLRTHDRIIYRTAGLALGGLALHSFVDFPLQVASIQLYAVIFFAYAWSTANDSKRLQNSQEILQPR
ncbi:MAG: O-antigen ligase family protein [Methylacidiphilales bacterium]|nr:O-antigen ligase family protein [Candidatus Methylacidiphilales bacterium]